MVSLEEIKREVLPQDGLLWMASHRDSAIRLSWIISVGQVEETLPPVLEQIISRLKDLHTAGFNIFASLMLRFLPRLLNRDGVSRSAGSLDLLFSLGGPLVSSDIL